LSCSASATILSCEGGSGPVACTVFKTGGRGDEPRRWVRLPCALASVTRGSPWDTDLWGKSGVHRCGTPEDRTPPLAETRPAIRCTTLGAPVSLPLTGRVWILTRRVPEHPVFTLSTCHANRRPASYRPPSRESTVRARKSRWLSQRRQVGRERMIKSRHRQPGCAKYRPRRYSRSVEFGGG